MQLGIVPTETLVEELGKRFDTLVVAGVRPRHGGTREDGLPEETQYEFFQGHRLKLLGLLEYHKFHLLGVMDETVTEAGPDD